MNQIDGEVRIAILNPIQYLSKRWPKPAENQNKRVKVKKLPFSQIRNAFSMLSNEKPNASYGNNVVDYNNP